MIGLLQDLLAPFYLQLKFIHLLAVMVWVWSTSVAYAYYLVPVFKAWRRNPGDEGVIELRNWVMERFDHGASYEHIAFPIVLLTGPLLYIAGGWSTSAAWLTLKILIIVGVFLPIEICDYYISHLGGNKRRIRETGDMVRYEQAIHRHWWFFLVTSGPVMVFAMAVIYLAVTKPI
ncbi:MAG: hypothetical protein JJU27_00825 [Gammaproteobacteria bacterium]|nr:hypothetical protein [Gammaproteobacteria bacterium]